MNGPVSRPAKGMTLHLAEIAISASARSCNAAAVAELARSTGAIGLQSAPTVIEREGRYVLVAGRHRIEALRLLGVESVLVRLVDFDDIEARLWTISENLHRAELTALQRAEHVAEYAELTQQKREASVLRQVGAKVGRPESGNRAAARELGLSEQEVRSAKAIAGLSEAAQAAAREEGLDGNQAALLRASQGLNAEAQVEALRVIGRRARVADEPERPGPAAKPLRNLENISGGELARWIKRTTPNDRPHVIRVLEMAAAILRDELRDEAAARPQNLALDGVSERSGPPPAAPSDESPPAASVRPRHAHWAAEGQNPDMTFDEIMASASAEGVMLALEGDDIVVDWNGEPPSGVLIAAIRNAKAEILSRLQAERRLIVHWIAAHLIDWPQESCFPCRKRIVAGQTFLDVANGEARARFHSECHPVWLADQEALARKTIGLRS